MRVLKPGGAFAVQDMFLDRRVYGDSMRCWTSADVGLEDVRGAAVGAAPSRGAWAGVACWGARRSWCGVKRGRPRAPALSPRRLAIVLSRKRFGALLPIQLVKGSGVTM